jgi:HD-like signal output (HDOD) protein
MCPTVVIATREQAEAESLADSLGGSFVAQPAIDNAALMQAGEWADAFVLDSEFSDCQGIDVLMDLVARFHAPVVMMTPPGDPGCAIEALRSGAGTYLVKSGNYKDLLPSALLDAIRRVTEVVELRDVVRGLRTRVVELERRRPAPQDAGQIDEPAEDAGEDDSIPTKGMAEEVASKLRSGEIVLPSYPKVAMALRELVEKDAGAAEIGELLAKDTAVSTKIMRAANAAVFANGKKASTVEDAVNRIGLTSACNLAEVVANQSLYAVANAAYKPWFESLWAHSVATAHAAQLIGQRVEGRIVPKLFTLGLLHDCGRLALLQVLAQIDPKGQRIAEESERAKLEEFLAQHHVPLGTSLMQRWNFDPEFKNVVQYHEDLTLAQNLSRPLLVIHLSNLFARSRGHGTALPDSGLLEGAKSKAFFGLSTEDMEFLGEELDRALEATRRMLR